MPGGTRAQLGNELFSQDLYLPAAAYPIVAANGTTDSTVAVAGVLPGDTIGWNMQAPPLHLVLDNAYVSAPGVITFRWSSDSAGITPGGTVAMLLQIARPENASLGLSALPSSIQ
jgi:hypothetical protein